MVPDEKKQPVLIVGSLAFDSIETPTGKADMALGGSASFASIAASYFSKPRIVGVVGEDFGNEHIDRFRRHAIDVDGVEHAAGRTFHWKGRYHDNFKERDTLETALNVFETFNPVIPQRYRDSHYVFLGNIDPKLQARVLDQTPAAEVVAMDTMNFWIETAREELLDVLRRVNILFINDEEALQLSEQPTILGAAEKILARGPRFVVIKRGEHGAVLFGDGPPLFVPAVLLPTVVDPTGAGDAFAGGFVGYLSSAGAPAGATREVFGRSLLWATVMASFAVEAFSVDALCDLPAESVENRRAGLEAMIRY